MPFVVPFEDILIPDYMLKPVGHKISGAKKHILAGNGWPLMVEKTDKGFLLRDGYARYLASKKLRLEEVEVEWADMELILLESIQHAERALAREGKEITEEDKRKIKQKLFEE